jgi:hypothetical protein
MQQQDSNWVYVVSLGSGTPKWSKLSWIDFVTKMKRYWHPFGGGGLKEPPNYLGFRYGGQLQSIYHVEKAEITKDLPGHFRGIINSRKWNAGPGPDIYILYKLGPAIRPPKLVKAGKITRACRVWAAIDLLLSCGTISKAVELTNRRFKDEN